MAKQLQSPPHAWIVPPDSLTTAELLAWYSEYHGVKPGVLGEADIPSMVGLVRLLVEERAAFQLMEAKERSRDATTHWRSCVALVASARRQLRLTQSSRVRAERAGVAHSDNNHRGATAGALIDPQVSNKESWRSLFPNSQTPAHPAVVPITRRRKKPSAGK